ncbi:MAG: hypothetical protein K2U26_07840 [Cyclobacteriaceae bacterium]|nr:hypothetical protein [Cyclobacteriaceae bacterium]
MKTYIELWKAKDTWRNLSKEDRANYLGQLAPAIQQLVSSGVEIVAWGENDSSTFKRAEYDFFGIWKFPTPEAVQLFEKMVEGAGWYAYFDQVNLHGDNTSPQHVLSKMIGI